MCGRSIGLLPLLVDKMAFEVPAHVLHLRIYKWLCGQDTQLSEDMFSS